MNVRTDFIEGDQFDQLRRQVIPGLNLKDLEAGNEYCPMVLIKDIAVRPFMKYRDIINNHITVILSTCILSPEALSDWTPLTHYASNVTFSSVPVIQPETEPKFRKYLEEMKATFFYQFAAEQYLVFPDNSTEYTELAFEQLTLRKEADVFSKENDLKDHLIRAIELIQKSFKHVQYYNVDLVEEPETADKWLSIDITLTGEIEEVRENYKKFLELWISTNLPENREKITLTYNII